MSESFANCEYFGVFYSWEIPTDIRPCSTHSVYGGFGHYRTIFFGVSLALLRHWFSSWLRCFCCFKCVIFLCYMMKLNNLIHLQRLQMSWRFLQPPNLHIFVTSSQLVSSLFIFGHTRSSTSSSLRITDRSFQYASPCLWNQLPASLHQWHTNLSTSASRSSLSGTSSTSSIDSPLSSSITPHSFISSLKLFFSANPSHRSVPFLLQYWLHGFPRLFSDTSELIRFLLFSFSPLLVVGSVR